jgi:hypothetical protein
MNADVAGCVGKSPYLTWRQAKTRCDLLNRRKNRADHMEPYRCSSCSKFHIGRCDPAYRRHLRRRRKEDS